MVVRLTTDSKACWVPVAAAVMLCIALVAACAQRPSPSSASQVKNTVPSAPAKIELNRQDMGTTDDTSRLSATLRDLFKRREAEHTFRAGTSDVEKTVALKAERSLKIGTFMKVAQTVKDAGASPLNLFIQVDAEKAGDIKPNPLMLLVGIGNPPYDLEKKATGIELYLTGFTVKRAEKDTLPGKFLVVEIPKDGEYVVEGTRIDKPALRDELERRLRESPKEGRVVVLVDGDSQFSYGSLEDVAYAAFDAHSSLLQLLPVAP